jgi:hypothetical protein
MAVGMGMFLVWQRSEIRRVGYQCGWLQRRAIQLEEDNRRLLSEVCGLRSPQLVTMKARSMGLGLVEHDQPPADMGGAVAGKKEPRSSAALAAVKPERRAGAAPRPR